MHVALPSSPVPIFPLPGAFLFPHQALPFHIFEPRYVSMVRDLLDSPGRLCIGTILHGQAEGQSHPALLPVAGFGEIVKHEVLDGNRYNIWVLGLCRVVICEVPSEHAYRQVLCSPFAEIALQPASERPVAAELRKATQQRLTSNLPLPEDTPASVLADLLVQTLVAPQPFVERVFAEPDVGERARLALQRANGANEAD